MPTPIATYSERRIFEERRFELYDDSLCFFLNQTFGSRAEVTIELATLNPEPAKAWIRDRRFESIMAFAILFGMIAVLMIPYLFLGADTFLDHWFKLLMVFIVAILAAVLSLIFMPRRIEYAGFSNHAGMVQLQVGRIGMNRVQFDEFVQLLGDKIADAQKTSA